jgi:hypothetical protein
VNSVFMAKGDSITSAPESHGGRSCRKDAGSGEQQRQGAEAAGDGGKYAGDKRESTELQRQHERQRPSKGQHPDVPMERQEIEGSNQRSSAQPCARLQQERRVFREMETHHCLCIHLQADQKPSVTPNTNNAALQKMPVCSA